MLMFLFDVRMIWMPNQTGPKEKVRNDMRRNKEQMSDLEVIKHLPTCFRKLYWQVRYVCFDEAPNYGKESCP